MRGWEEFACKWNGAVTYIGNACRRSVALRMALCCSSTKDEGRSESEK